MVSDHRLRTRVQTPESDEATAAPRSSGTYNHVFVPRITDNLRGCLDQELAATQVLPIEQL